MGQGYTQYVGLDVHKDSITAAMVSGAPGAEVIDLGCIATQHHALDRLLRSLQGRGPLKVVYEAGPCGFWLERFLRSRGIDCQVVAPSLIPKRPGVRIKSDRRDARGLALALRAGTLTAVHIPTPEQEAFRDLVRAMAQSTRDITKAKQRLKGFLLRNDIRYTGKATWNAAHRRWLSQLVLPEPLQQLVFQELVDTITEREARRARLEAALEERAPQWSGHDLAHALTAFRGVQDRVACTVVAEVGDLRRFAEPRGLMAWIGLVPSAYNSGPTRRHGPITKSGNKFVRTALIEAAWAYRHPAKVSAIIERRAGDIDPAIRAIAWKAQLRLCRKFRRMRARGKHQNVVVTAIARELAAFLWAAAREHKA
jgi:transposase